MQYTCSSCSLRGSVASSNQLGKSLSCELFLAKGLPAVVFALLESSQEVNSVSWVGKTLVDGRNGELRNTPSAINLSRC